MSRAILYRVVCALLVLTFLASLALTRPAATARAVAPAAAPAQATPATSGVPRFEPAPCVYRLPRDQQEGRTVTCGYAIVPERHSQPSGKTIRLPVAVYKAIGGTAAPEPIVLLAGGPGQDSQIFAELLTGPFYRALAANNDVVFFDQRGTGRSEPVLTCPELSELNSLTDKTLVRALQTQSAFVDLILTCRDRLTAEGVDLAAYTTAENAADVNAVRAVLGYARMNLYGGSYGSELGLAVERDFPQFVRSAALVSLVPLQTAFFAEQAVNFDRALNLLFQSCAAQPSCNAAYPDLKGLFQRTVAQLNAAPAVVQVTDPASGQTVDIPIDGVFFSNLLFVLLYASELIPFLPDVISKTQQGDTAFLDLVLTALVEGDNLPWAMHFSMVCTHDASDSRREQMLAANARILPEARAALESQSLDYFTICPQWPTQGADPKADLPVISDVPTLLVNGQFDPITPPSYGQLVAQGLSGDYLVDLPGGGHSATFGFGPVAACGTAIVLGFFADPTRPPDTSCVALLGVTFAPLPALPGGAAPQPTPTPMPTRTPTPTPTATPGPMPGLPNTGYGGSAPSASGGAGAAPLPVAFAVLGLGMLAALALVRRRCHG